MRCYNLHANPSGHRTAVERVYRVLNKHRDEWDAIYCTGQSGIVPSSVVAWRLKRPLLILSKPGDRHGNILEGDIANREPRNHGKRVVIVDDFISCGDTLARLLNALPSHLQLTGLVLYAHPANARERREGKVFTNNCHTVRRIGASDSRRFSIEGRSIWQSTGSTSKPAGISASAGTPTAGPPWPWLGQGTITSGRRSSQPPLPGVE